MEKPPADAAATDEPATDEANWDRLLSSALDHGSEDRTFVEEMASAPPSEKIGKLAALLLEEWDLASADPRLQQPRLVWVPPVDLSKLPLASRQRVAPLATVRGVVGPDGRLRDPRLQSSTGSPAVDELALQAARQAGFRPARGPDGYREQSSGLTLRWHF